MYLGITTPLRLRPRRVFAAACFLGAGLQCGSVWADTAGYPNIGTGSTMHWASTTPSPGESRAVVAAMDAAGAYAYVVSGSQLIKLALADGATSLTRLGAIPLEQNESPQQQTIQASLMLDETRGYGYVLAYSHAEPAVITKFALGEGAQLPRRVGSVSLEQVDKATVYSADIDELNGYAYLLVGTQPQRVVKVKLGTGDALPQRVGAMTLSADDNSTRPGSLAVAAGYGYLGTASQPTPRIVKFRLGEGAYAPTPIGRVLLPPAIRPTNHAFVDAAGGYAYFSAVENELSSPHYLLKAKLQEGDALPVYLGAGVLDSYENADPRPMTLPQDTSTSLSRPIKSSKWTLGPPMLCRCGSARFHWRESRGAAWVSATSGCAPGSLS